MSLKRYAAKINGLVTVVKLTEDEAKRRGLKPAVKAKTPPPNKSRVPQNKEAAGDESGSAAPSRQHD